MFTAKGRCHTCGKRRPAIHCMHGVLECDQCCSARGRPAQVTVDGRAHHWDTWLYCGHCRQPCNGTYLHGCGLEICGLCNEEADRTCTLSAMSM